MASGIIGDFNFTSVVPTVMAMDNALYNTATTNAIADWIGVPNNTGIAITELIKLKSNSSKLKFSAGQTSALSNFILDLQKLHQGSSLINIEKLYKKFCVQPGNTGLPNTQAKELYSLIQDLKNNVTVVPQAVVQRNNQTVAEIPFNVVNTDAIPSLPVLPSASPQAERRPVPTSTLPVTITATATQLPPLSSPAPQGQSILGPYNPLQHPPAGRTVTPPTNASGPAPNGSRTQQAQVPARTQDPAAQAAAQPGDLGSVVVNGRAAPTPPKPSNNTRFTAVGGEPEFIIRPVNTNQYGPGVRMELMPARQSWTPGQGQRVPGAGAGLSIQTKANIAKLLVPGARPIYQHMGINEEVISFVGAFVGFDTPLAGAPELGNDAREVPDIAGVKNRNLNAYQDAMRLVKEITPGYELELIMRWTTDRNETLALEYTDGITYRGFIQDFKQELATAQRVYYRITMVVTNREVDRTALGANPVPPPPAVIAPPISLNSSFRSTATSSESGSSNEGTTILGPVNILNQNSSADRTVRAGAPPVPSSSRTTSYQIYRLKTTISNAQYTVTWDVYRKSNGEIILNSLVGDNPALRPLNYPPTKFNLLSVPAAEMSVKPLGSGVYSSIAYFPNVVIPGKYFSTDLNIGQIRYLKQVKYDPVSKKLVLTDIDGFIYNVFGPTILSLCEAILKSTTATAITVPIND